MCGKVALTEACRLARGTRRSHHNDLTRPLSALGGCRQKEDPPDVLLYLLSSFSCSELFLNLPYLGLEHQCRDAQLRLPTAPRREMEIAEKERLGIGRQVSKGSKRQKDNEEAEYP